MRQSQDLSPESTNWLAPQQQQSWFDRFALKGKRGSGSSKDDDDDSSDSALGLRFQQFQEFLKVALYSYFEKFSQKQQACVDSEQRCESSRGNHRELEGSDLTGPLSKLGLTSAAAAACPDEGSMFTKQQEMHLFRKFDQKNDHVIDRDEFSLLCQKWLHQVFNPTCGLLIVDVQNDFIDGSLALIKGSAGQDGADVVPVVNDLIDTCQRHSAAIVYTQDWHPPDHISFHGNLYLRKHTLKEDKGSKVATDAPNKEVAAAAEERDSDNKSNGARVATCGSQNELKYKKFASEAKLFDTVLFDEGRVEQKLWPIHCVSNSWGAQLHAQLKIAPDSIKIQKGTLSHVDAYSAFWDNMRSNETGLRQELLAKGVTDLFVCGLALDYCVAASALDAAKAGFITFVVEDACRGIDLNDIESRKRELRDQGAFLVRSDMVDNYLRRRGLDRSLIKTITYRKAFS